MVAAAAEMTVDQLFMSFPFLHWGDYLTVPSVLDIPGLRAAFEANRFGQATPTTAMYVYHGVHEQNLPDRRRRQVRRDVPSRRGQRDLPPDSIR